MPLDHLRADVLRAGPDLEAIRHLGSLIAWDRPVGVPRSELTVPLSPDGRVDDTVLFEAPGDQSPFSIPGVSPDVRHFYVPRYRVQLGEFNGLPQITTEFVDGQWRMTFDLANFAAPEIEAAGVPTAMLPHDLSVTVSSGSSLVRSYPVAEFSTGATDAGFFPRVVLLLTLEQRDELLRAFMRDEEQARIELHRSITVAVPVADPLALNTLVVATQPDPLGTPVILPDLVLANFRSAIAVPMRLVEPASVPPESDEERAVRPRIGLRPQLAVDPSFAKARSSRLAFSQPEEPGILRRADVLATPADAVRRFPGDLEILIPTDVGGVFIPDPGTQPDPRPDPAPEQHYTVVSTTLTTTVPLRYDFETNPELFPAGRPTAGGGFATRVVAWPPEGVSSRNHVYFQDQSARNVFYHLPDAFLIGQRDQAPYGPELSFTVGRTSETEGGAERAVALISVHLVPQTSAARLYNAAQVLKEQLPAGSAAPELRPALHPATCRLELPDAAITTSAPPDLVRGWWVSEVFDFDDLRDVYAVLTTGGAASALLRGRVDVDVMGQTHQVPVEVRLDRPAVPPLSWVELPRFDGKRTVDLTLRNDGDVTVTLPSLAAWISAGREPQPAVATGALPAQLAPGGSVTLEVRPSKRVVGKEAPDVHLDLTAARVVVEPEKAVEQTLDRRVARLPKVVTLFTNEGRLGTTGDPEQDIDVVVLEFQGVTGAVVLDRETMQRDVAIPVPLVDLLLDRGTGEFRYKQTVVRLSGASQRDTDWRTSSETFLLLPQT